MGPEALLHLTEVAAGLHSIVLGEREILGQVRSAFASAPPRLARLGGVAVAAAREFRAGAFFDTHTGHLLDRALRLSGVQSGGDLLVIGAGAAGRAVAERAFALGYASVAIAARQQPAGAWFEAGAFTYLPLTELAKRPAVDVIVSCLGSGADELHVKNDLPGARRLIVDLGTPRNLAGDPGVPLIDIARMWESEFGRPHAESRRAQGRARLRVLLQERLTMLEQDSRSTVGRLRQEIERIRAAEVARALRLHPEVPPAAMESITRSLVNQLFHLPTERLRQQTNAALAYELAGLFAPADCTTEADVK